MRKGYIQYTHVKNPDVHVKSSVDYESTQTIVFVITQQALKVSVFGLLKLDTIRKNKINLTDTGWWRRCSWSRCHRVLRHRWGKVTRPSQSVRCEITVLLKLALGVWRQPRKSPCHPHKSLTPTNSSCPCSMHKTFRAFQVLFVFYPRF